LGSQTASERLLALKTREHSRCFVCSGLHPHGLGLDFQIQGTSVETAFSSGDQFQGYPGVLHGGIISSLIDGAMTNCLFAQGKAAVTAELALQFKHPVAASRPLRVKAWITHDYCPLYVLDAELIQDGKVMARATGKFMLRD
jgi:acyl-coenzyme A thioesterase PaaI-like protein